MREATENEVVALRTYSPNKNYFLVSKYLQLTIIYLLSGHLALSSPFRKHMLNIGGMCFKLAVFSLSVFVYFGVYASPPNLTILFQSSDIQFDIKYIRVPGLKKFYAFICIEYLLLLLRASSSSCFFHFFLVFPCY